MDLSLNGNHHHSDEPKVAALQMKASSQQRDFCPKQHQPDEPKKRTVQGTPFRSVQKKMQESKNTVHFPSGSYVTIKSAFFIRLTVF